MNRGAAVNAKTSRWSETGARFLARVLFLPTLAWNYLLARVLHVRNWWDPIDADVVIGALPLAGDIPAMRAARIAAVVNTCREYRGPIDAYVAAEISQLWIPTTDFTAPSLDDVESAVRFMQQEIAQGKRVYVHCKAGRARSATVVLCWLVKAKHMSPDEAQQLILAKRPHANRHLVQRPVVQQFAARHHGAPNG